MKKIDDKILEDIKNNTENIQIPDSLSPDNMMAKIAKKKAEGYFEENTSETSKNKKKGKKFNKKFVAWMTGGAATIVVAASLGIILLGSGAKRGNIRYEDADSYITDIGFNDDNQVDSLTTYEKLAQYYIVQNTMREKNQKNGFELFWESLFGSNTKGEAGLENGIATNTPDMMVPEGDFSDNEDVIGGSSDSDYSDTNTRTENVAEADVVKTDGEYIYSLNEKVDIWGDEDWKLILKVVKADGENTEKVCEIVVNKQVDKIASWELPIDMGCYEMMLYEDKLVIVCTNEGYTVLMFYDITDKSAVKYENRLYIEGEYDSCRMVNGYLYVFAEKSLAGTISRHNFSTAIAKEKLLEKIIPCTSEGDVPEKDVYISNCEELDLYHMIGTVDMNNTSEFKQVKAVLGSGKGVVYVSAENIYYISSLYEKYDAYEVGEEVEYVGKSEIVRLGYKDGVVEPKGRTVIEGEIDDEFDIDEYNGYLRIAASVYRWRGVCNETEVEYYNGTEWVDDRVKHIDMMYISTDMECSSLYVLDSNLGMAGSIPDLKKGEQVYGVRFDGDIGYVVTYKNMDPLFTIDLSDPTNPKVLGALKIPGFSTYLHKWDDNKLIGIGYDEHGYVKISTFDITDKTDVKETDVCVISDAFGSEALYNHKAIFISPKNNLVGFVDYAGCYRIFSYVEGELTEVIELYLEKETGNEYARGLYIGENIYVVSENEGVYVYRMSDYEQVTVAK